MSDQPIDRIDPAEEYTLEIWLDDELLERGRLSRIDHAGMGFLDELIAEYDAEAGAEFLSDFTEDWAIDAGLQGEPVEAQILRGWPSPTRPLPVMTHRLEADAEVDTQDDVGRAPEASETGPGTGRLDQVDAGAPLTGETATLAATCAYFIQLAAHVRRDIDPQLDLADGALRERGLDQETLTDLGRIRALLTAVETALTALAAAVRDRHGHIADAINSAPADTADTSWYRAASGGGALRVALSPDGQAIR